MEGILITIYESECCDRQAALMKIAEALSFANFNGVSLDAFYDCCSEVCEPVTIELIPEETYGCSAWLHEVCRVLNLVAEEKDNIKVICSIRNNVDKQLGNPRNQ